MDEDEEGAGDSVSKRQRVRGEGPGVANCLCGCWGLLKVLEMWLGAGEVAVRPWNTLGLCGGTDEKAGCGFGGRRGVEKVRLGPDEAEACCAVLSSLRL